MKVLIDAGSLMKELTGVGVYVKNLLNEMIPLDKSVQYYVFLNAFKGKTPQFKWQNESNVTFIRKKIPGKLLLELWRKDFPPAIESLAGCIPDVFHSTNFFYHRTVCKNVVATIHDLAFVKRMDYGDRYSGAFHRQILTKKLNKIKHFIVVSKTVKQDLERYFQIPGDLISVIHHGIHPRLLSSDNSIESNSFQTADELPENFLLFVGTVEPRKNIPLLIKAFKGISNRFSDVHLVIVGRAADGMQSVRDTVDETHLHSKVHVKGYVDDEALDRIYKKALLAVFPSWDEGFGFPPLEAMTYQIPVLASDIPVHQEMLGKHANYFSTDSQDSLQSGLLNALSNLQTDKSRLESAAEHASSFTWKQSAEQHLEVYKKVLLC
jgi:glycosyltransferase involved in cell wall biosynthesis